MVIPVRGTSTGTVSQDQKAIMLTQDGSSSPGMMLPVSGSPDGATPRMDLPSDGSASMASSSSVIGGSTYSVPQVANPSGVLDGFKITSFSPTRAIINGPGGSRIVFDNEETILGGVPWMVLIQKSGIEFAYQDQRVLLLFDRSLSSINRVNASSVGGDAADSGANAVGAEASGSSSAPAAAPAAASAPAATPASDGT